MNESYALNSYSTVQREGSVQNASPHKLIDLLFEGAIERINQAKGAIEYNNIELRGKKINSAISIVSGLQMSLNTDEGGEIAQNLESLYIYIQRILAQAHLKSDMALLDEAASLIGEIRSGWQQIQ